MKWLSQEGLTTSLDVMGEDEEKAEKYFWELVNRNIITPVAANRRHNGNPDDEAEACRRKISHYMWQILAFISAEKGFAFTSTSCTLTSTTAAPEAGGDNKAQTVRRLAIHHPNAELPALLESMDLSQTRCLVMSGAVDQIPLHKFLYLVVLDLEGWENLKDEDMEQICSKMYLLLHLSIRNTRVTKLPEQIQELCSLRTLDVSHTEITKLPTQIKGLCNLRTLDASHTRISDLPSEVYMLENLWRLDLRGTHIMLLAQHVPRISKHLGHILVDGEIQGIHISDSLRTLPAINLRKQSASLVKSLGDLTHLRVLAITWSFGQCTDKEYCDALLSSIKKWRKLKSLTFDCGFSFCMDFLSGLSQGLEKFKVTMGTFTRVPEWIGMLNSLSSLQITVCKLESDDLQKLRGLPRLHRLVLGLEFIPTEEIVIESEGFCWVFTLSVNCAMPWVTFREGAMRRLECLELEVCSGPANRESAVPSGITNLGSLTEVLLHYNKDWCSSSSSVKKTVEAVKEEVAKHSKPINLVINGTIHDVRQIDQNMEVANEIESEEVQGEAQSHAQLSW
ncbi:hypothetical protein BS78_05G204600 [Paspalum vaginatum]|nr:hypothetical protein BS78_05G204600 [Paspalum vaginatum]